MGARRTTTAGHVMTAAPQMRTPPARIAGARFVRTSATVNERASLLARAVLGLLIAAWLAAFSLFLLHRIVVSNDSLSNYGHVWLISQHLREHHWLPWKLPQLLHGSAQAFPYGFVPWTLAALLRPLLGDWGSTLWMVIGTAGVIAATFAAFPELRRPLAAACVLANPVLVEMFILFQMPFSWAAAMFLAAVWAFRRERYLLAALLAGAAQATHAAVLMPVVLGAAALTFWRCPAARRPLAATYAGSLVLAVPVAAIVLASPVVEDTSRVTVATNLLGTVAWRALVFAVPALLAWLAVRRQRWLPAALLALVVLNPLLVPLRHNSFAWGLFFRSPDRTVESFTRGSLFEPGATYRILRAGDGKVGMYQLIRAGAQLDSEFFPESIDRRSWPNEDSYARFLASRSVEYVMIFENYDRTFGSNEGNMLTGMVADGCATVTVRNPGYAVYNVNPSHCGATP